MWYRLRETEASGFPRRMLWQLVSPALGFSLSRSGPFRQLSSTQEHTPCAKPSVLRISFRQKH